MLRLKAVDNSFFLCRLVAADKSFVARKFAPALIILLSLPFLTGCGQAVESWVRAAQPLFGIPIKFEGQSNVKISPGTTVSKSADISAKIHVTITDRLITSGDVSASVSLNQTRTAGISP
ncbi:hypothetical protein BH10BDE1_BH10BDE1_34000 [soil metagenome]